MKSQAYLMVKAGGLFARENSQNGSSSWVVQHIDERRKIRQETLRLEFKIIDILLI